MCSGNGSALKKCVRAGVAVRKCVRGVWLLTSAFVERWLCANSVVRCGCVGVPSNDLSNELRSEPSRG